MACDAYGKKSLMAGCNLVLYCAGKYKESYKLLKTLPIIGRLDFTTVTS